MSALLSAQHVSKHYGTRSIIEDFSLTLKESDRLALIGANGCGKSTLLRILAGIDEPDDGQVVCRRDLTVSFVPQSVTLNSELTVQQVLVDSLQHIDELERSIRISRWLSRTTALDGGQQVGHLSGGQKKRLQLLCGITKQPDVLLLDEPTNHLDLDAIIWLESVLEQFAGAIIFVSHDRYLIEDVAEQVVELAPWYPNGYLQSTGSYSEFLHNQSLFLSSQSQTQASLENRARRELEWLRRGAKAQRKKSKSRIAAAHTLLNTVQNFQRLEETPTFDFAKGARKSHDLVRVLNLSQSIGGNDLFSDLTLTLKPGTRLGVVGPNGSGKSTLLKALCGELEPTAGRILPALGCRTVYFDQHRGGLNPNISLREALCPDGDSVSFNDKLIHVTAWAKRFRFKPDQLSSRVGDLSGGELARAILAKLMREPADLLLLDEPTNDLDIATLEVLEDALTEFHGAVVMVSHDRYFLERVCTGILCIDAGKAEPFADYDQWQEQRALEKQAKRESAEPTSTTAPSRQEGPKNKRPLTFAERLELEGIEARIEKGEALVASLEEQLRDPELASDSARLTELCSSLEEARTEVENLYSRWDTLETKSKGE